MVRGATGSGVRCKYVMIGANMRSSGLIISQIRNARELVHLRRICERQNLKAQRATDAKNLDFGDIIS